jgi:acetyl-CoA carboxylase alpha subunit
MTKLQALLNEKNKFVKYRDETNRQITKLQKQLDEQKASYTAEIDKVKDNLKKEINKVLFKFISEDTVMIARGDYVNFTLSIEQVRELANWIIDMTEE